MHLKPEGGEGIRLKVVVSSRAFGRMDTTGSKMLQDAGLDLVYLSGKGNPQEELAVLMRENDTAAVVGAAIPITREMIFSSPSLRVIAVAGATTTQVDLEAAKARGIVVKAVPGGNAEAVADLTWGLILSVARGIPRADRMVRSGEWKPVTGFSLTGNTLSLLGFGHIGKAVARRAVGFSVRVLAYDLIKEKKAARELDVTYVTLDEALREADILSIHLPLNNQTHLLIGERELRKMKPTAVLINTSRGLIVDEDALYKALSEGWIAGAGLDVFSVEPPNSDHPLFQAPTCVLTPNIGAHTYETARFIGVQTAKTILDVLELHQ